MKSYLKLKPEDCFQCHQLVEFQRNYTKEINLIIFETRQPFSPAQKYLIKPECKNLCVEFVRYTTHILLHIATIHTSPYREVF